MTFLRKIPGVYAAVGNEDSCRAWDLPADRIGDIMVVGDMNSVLGFNEAAHQHLNTGQRLRSSGSMEETVVPIIVNRPLKPSYAQKMNRGKSRNFDLFDYLLNGIERQQQQPESH